jgi:tubulin beta
MHDIGGDGKYFGGNDAQLSRINVLYHEASGGKYVPRTVFFEPDMIDALRASSLGKLFRPGNHVKTRGATGPKATSEGLRINCSDPTLQKG